MNTMATPTSIIVNPKNRRSQTVAYCSVQSAEAINNILGMWDPPYIHDRDPKPMPGHIGFHYNRIEEPLAIARMTILHDTMV